MPPQPLQIRFLERRYTIYLSIFGSQHFGPCFFMGVELWIDFEEEPTFRFALPGIDPINA